MSNVIKDFEKCVDMGVRIYNNKMIKKEEGETLVYSDDNAIKGLVGKIFNANGEVSNYDDLRSFNALIVKVAEKEAEAKVKPILDAISNYKKVNKYDVQVYKKIPKRANIKMALSASATGVDFTKITSTMTQVPATPKLFQFGVQYEISEMVNDPVNAFRTAVDEVAKAKVVLILNQVLKLARESQSAGQIPAKQFKEFTNMTLPEFRTLENVLIRRGGNSRPVMIADQSFISEVAIKQGNSGLGDGFSILTEELKKSLLRDITFEVVSRTIAIPMDNPFLDFEGTKLELKPQEALMLVGGGEAPYSITEFGGIRQTEGMPQVENEKVLVKIDYKIDITLLVGENLAYIKDSAITV